MKAWAWLLALSACAAPPTPFSPARLAAHAAALAAPELGGRPAGSDGERRALAYVARELDRAHVPPPPHAARLHAFTLTSGGDSANAYGFVRGATGLADEQLVLGAHVDHLGVVDGALHAGAEDNASGVAVVLEVARALARRRAELGRSVVIAFFGAEEVGKQGSAVYVADPPLPLERTLAMINVDMIGLPLLDQTALWLPKLLFGLDDERSVGVVGTEGRAGLGALVRHGCRRARVLPVAPEDFPDFIRDMINERAKNRGDDASFEAAGVPAVFFGSGEADSYHSPDDTLDALQPELMAARANAILETLVLLSRADWGFVR